MDRQIHIESREYIVPLSMRGHPRIHIIVILILQDPLLCPQEAMPWLGSHIQYETRLTKQGIYCTFRALGLKQNLVRLWSQGVLWQTSKLRRLRHTRRRCHGQSFLKSGFKCRVEVWGQVALLGMYFRLLAFRVYDFSCTDCQNRFACIYICKYMYLFLLTF